MEVTLQHIANELNISAMTVSLSLRHDPSVSPAMRARVHEVARRMGYKARRGRPRRVVEPDTRSRSLGLLLRDRSVEEAHHDATLMKLMAGIMSVTNVHGIQLKIDTLQFQESQYLDETESHIPTMIQESGCQALIVHGNHSERDLEFLSRRLPVVSISRSYPELAIDSVVADNVQGIYRLVTRLVMLGHRRLSWVGSHYSASFMEERMAGFMKGYLAHNLELHQYSFFGREIFRGDGPRESLLAAVNDGVTAFVCGNDGVAYSVIEILEGAGKRVPDDISVTGFDASYPSIPGLWNWRNLTGIDPDFFEIGKMTARLALQRLSFPNDNPCILSVRGEVVQGDTIRALPTAVTTKINQ